jgi:RHS repeat-associated protein
LTYDENGNLTRRDDPANGVSTYTYDKLNRLTREAHPGARSVDYTYDANGNALTVTDWVGGTARTSTYRYDATDQLRDLAEPGGSCTTATPTRCTSYLYDERDNRRQIGYPNGVVVTNTFDTQDKVTSIVAKQGATVLKSRSYDYDKFNRHTELRQRVTDEAANTTTYGYDGLDRLIRADISSQSGTLIRNWAYTYDGASNRLSVGGSGVVDERYAYNEANQLCWRAPASTTLRACADQPTGQTRYSYDANGNETSRGLTYNVRNVTTSMTPPGGVAGALSYLGTSSDELVSDAGASLQNNALGVAARIAGATTTLYTRDTSGGLVAERVGTATRYPLRDALGSTLALTNSAGAKISGSDVDYDPFGVLLNAPTVTTQVGFAGGYIPAAAGAMRLHHFGQRYMDPATGRWTQQDSLDNPSDLRQSNRYLYVGDDPVNLVDPTGELSCSTLGIGHVCKAAQRAASSVVHPLRTLYNAATGCLTYGEIGFFAGLSVGRPDVGAIAGCAGGAVIGQFAPTAPYEGGGIPLR